MSSLQLWSCSGLCWGCWHGVHCQGTRACWSSLGNTMMLLHGRESRVRLGSPSPAKESPSPSPSTVLFILHPALSGFCRSKPHLCHCSSEEMQLPAPPAPSWLASRCVPGSQTSPPQSLLARIILGVLQCPRMLSLSLSQTRERLSSSHPPSTHYMRLISLPKTKGLFKRGLQRWPGSQAAREQEQRKEGRNRGETVCHGLPVPGMVLCTGLTERGPKDPEVETWGGTEADSQQLALRGCRPQHATPSCSLWSVLAPRQTYLHLSLPPMLLFTLYSASTVPISRVGQRNQDEYDVCLILPTQLYVYGSAVEKPEIAALPESPELQPGGAPALWMLQTGCSHAETPRLVLVSGTNHPFSFEELWMGENPHVTITNLVAVIKASLGHLVFSRDTLTTGKTDEQSHTLCDALTGKPVTKAAASKIHGLQATLCVCDCSPNVLCNK